MNKIVNADEKGWHISGMASVIPTEKKGEWELGYKLVSCRSVLQDWLHNPKKCDYTLSAREKSEDFTYIFFTGNPGKVLDLSKLHEKEDSIGVPRTTLIPVDKGVTQGFIFKGDKIWQSALWKVSLYSYYLKQIVSRATEYDHVLSMSKKGKTYEEYFLAKITADLPDWKPAKFEGKPGEWTWSHNQVGFCSISLAENIMNTVPNKEMHKLIFGEE